MANLDLQKALIDATAAVLEGREILLKHFKRLKHVQEKEQAGLVSEADLESETAITTYLKSCYPEIPMLGEEQAFKNNSSDAPGKTFWVLDPLDGTTNYVHGFSIFCISLSLVVDDQLTLGVVDVPLLNTTYTAIRGQGAYRDKSRLQVSETSSLKKSLLATGFFADDADALELQIKIFSHFVAQARGIRRAGAAAYDLCLVAEGVFDAFWEKNLKPWDTAAGVLLIREAGGQVTTYQGEEYKISDDTILASNKNLFAAISTELSKSCQKTKSS